MRGRGRGWNKSWKKRKERKDERLAARRNAPPGEGVVLTDSWITAGYHFYTSLSRQFRQERPTRSSRNSFDGCHDPAARDLDDRRLDGLAGREFTERTFAAPYYFPAACYSLHFLLVQPSVSACNDAENRLLSNRSDRTRLPAPSSPSKYASRSTLFASDVVGASKRTFQIGARALKGGGERKYEARVARCLM